MKSIRWKIRISFYRVYFISPMSGSKKKMLWNPEFLNWPLYQGPLPYLLHTEMFFLPSICRLQCLTLTQRTELQPQAFRTTQKFGIHNFVGINSGCFASATDFVKLWQTVRVSKNLGQSAIKWKNLLLFLEYDHFNFGLITWSKLKKSYYSTSNILDKTQPMNLGSFSNISL